MNDPLNLPELQGALSPYQLSESLKSAVRAGDSPRVLALIEWMQNAQSPDAPQQHSWTNDGFWGGRLSPLMLVLDPEQLAGRPVDIALVKALLDAGCPVDSQTPGRPGPLSFAIRSGSLPAVELLIERGANVNEGPQGPGPYPHEPKSLLVQAIEAGQSAIARRLLEAGADPHGAPEWPRPLQAAARFADLETARALIEHGVVVNAQYPDAIKPALNSANYSPSVSALMEAARIKENPVLPLLLEQGADISARGESTSQTALHMAAHFAWPQNVRLLLEAGSDVRLADGNGKTPPECARTGQATIPFNGETRIGDVITTLAIMVRHGADPALIPQYSRKLLGKALLNSEREAVTRLLRLIPRVSETKFIKMGNESFDLLSSCAGGLIRQLESFAEESGAMSPLTGPISPEDNARRDTEREAALDATMKQDAETARSLLAHGLEPTPSALRAALKTAVRLGHVELARFVLEIGASPDEGEPLHFAARGGHAEIVDMLLRAGANPNAVNTKGFTPLMLAVSFSKGASRRVPNRIQLQFSDAAKRAIEADVRIARALLSSGADLHVRGIDDYGVLHFAACEATPAVVRVLLDAGTDPHARNIEGATPLFNAVSDAPPAAVRMLLDAGADPNARNTEGMMPLHNLLENGRRPELAKTRPGYENVLREITPTLAPINRNQQAHSISQWQRAGQDDEDILQMLLANGADVNAPQADGCLPIHLAAIHATPKAVQMLLDAGALLDALHPNGGDAVEFAFQWGRVSRLFLREGWELEDFTWVADELTSMAKDASQTMGSKLQSANLEVQGAAHEDALVIRVLLAAGAQID